MLGDSLLRPVFNVAGTVLLRELALQVIGVAVAVVGGLVLGL